MIVQGPGRAGRRAPQPARGDRSAITWARAGKLTGLTCPPSLRGGAARSARVPEPAFAVGDGGPMTRSRCWRIRPLPAGRRRRECTVTPTRAAGPTPSCVAGLHITSASRCTPSIRAVSTLPSLVGRRASSSAAPHVLHSSATACATASSNGWTSAVACAVRYARHKSTSRPRLMSSTTSVRSRSRDAFNFM